MQVPKFLLDPLIRHKARLHDVPLDRYTVRVATTAQEYEDAFRLLQVAFIVQGYESVRARPFRITRHHVLPEATVLVAYEGNRLVGTMTLTLDSPAGLPMVERHYGAAVAALRRDGVRLSEWGSLAVLAPCVGTGVTLLLNMAAYRHSCHQLGATHALVEVHPRGLALYRALFGFEPIGPVVPHGELQVDIVGLALDLYGARDFVRRRFNKPMSTGKSVFEHFMDPPACVQLPPLMSDESYAMWKMPPPLFDRLFSEKSDVLALLTPEVRSHLCRSMARRAPEDVPESLMGLVRSGTMASLPSPPTTMR
jgi:hypothetical protein